MRGVVGDWFDKQDELKQALCDAGEKCWTGSVVVYSTVMQQSKRFSPSDECKTQKEELKDAVCACKEEHKTEVEAALDKCAGSPS